MDCGMRTTDCGLGIKYGLGIKRGLENIDWVYNADCGLQTGYKYRLRTMLVKTVLIVLGKVKIIRPEDR